MANVNKRICIISTIDGTLSSFVIPSAREMKKRGLEVTLLASMSNEFVERYNDEFTLINIQMERGAKPLGMIKAIFSFYKLFKTHKFDIIQYATPNAAFYASIAGFLSKKPIRLYCQWGIRYVGFDGLKRKIFKLLEKITCNLSTHIRPASRKNMEFAIEEKLYKQDKAKVIGDGGAVGIDFKRFDIEKKAIYKQEILEKYPQIKDKTVFGFVGRLEEDKGIVELIEAFKSINEGYLIVVGGMSTKKDFLNDLIAQAKNNDKIILTGIVSDVEKYLSAFTILVHPSYREGFSAVIQQAMAMRTPVITTDIPGPSEVIEENISGLLVPPKNSEKLSDAMQHLSSNIELQNKFSDNGLVRVKKLFSQSRMTELIVLDRLDLISNI